MRVQMTALCALRRFLFAAAVAMAAALPVHAQLKIEVTSGVTDPIPIAVVPFARSVPADGGLDVAQVVQHDLEGRGRWRALPRPQMLATPTEVGGLNLNDWKTLGQDYV